MPRRWSNVSEKLQPARGILNRSTRVIESLHELVKRGQVGMIWRLHIQPVQLSLTLDRIACGQRARNAICQGHHGIVEEQVHLWRVLCRQIPSSNELMQLRI